MAWLSPCARGHRISRTFAPAQAWRSAGPQGPVGRMWLQGTLMLLSPLSPCTEKKCYRESYISDTLELDLHPASSGDSGDSRDGGWRPSPRLSLLSADSQGSSSGMEPGEMSVDGSLETEALHGEEPSCSFSKSRSSGDTDGGSSGGRERDTWDPDPEKGECAANRPGCSHCCGHPPEKRGARALDSWFVTGTADKRAGCTLQGVEGRSPSVLLQLTKEAPRPSLTMRPPESVSASFSCSTGSSTSPRPRGHPHR